MLGSIISIRNNMVDSYQGDFMDQDIIYTSGFFDGEGNIHMALDKRVNPPRVVLMVTITNSEKMFSTGSKTSLVEM